jgi:hypothetical protein
MSLARLCPSQCHSGRGGWSATRGRAARNRAIQRLITFRSTRSLWRTPDEHGLYRNWHRLGNVDMLQAMTCAAALVPRTVDARNKRVQGLRGRAAARRGGARRAGKLPDGSSETARDLVSDSKVLDGKPWQVVDPPRAVPPVLETVADEHEARAIARAEGEIPFDLQRGPLLRVRVLRWEGADLCAGADAGLDPVGGRHRVHDACRRASRRVGALERTAGHRGRRADRKQDAGRDRRPDRLFINTFVMRTRFATLSGSAGPRARCDDRSVRASGAAVRAIGRGAQPGT